MATMNFSIPADVKEAFNKAFEGENKSAIVAALLRKAVEEREHRAKEDEVLDALIEELMRARAEDPPMSDEAIRQARHQGRP